MAQLTTEVARLFDANSDPKLQRIGVLNAVKVFRGSALGLSGTSGRQLVATDTFLGFAEDSQDNSGGNAGDKVVTYRQQGTVKVPVTGASSSSLPGDAVYMSDGNTFTTTSTSNTQVGKIVRWYSGTTCDVYFEGVGVRSI